MSKKIVLEAAMLVWELGFSPNPYRDMQPIDQRKPRASQR